MEQEVWKDIKGYEGLYQISNLGNVMSLHYGRTNQPNLLKPQDDHKSGYLKVGFYKNGEYKIFLYIDWLRKRLFLINQLLKVCLMKTEV